VRLSGACVEGAVSARSPATGPAISNSPLEVLMTWNHTYVYGHIIIPCAYGIAQTCAMKPAVIEFHQPSSFHKGEPPPAPPTAIPTAAVKLLRYL